MNKKIVILLSFLLLFTGCSNEDKTIKCTLVEEDTTTIVTISKISDKVIVTTDETKEVCLDDNTCSFIGDTSEEESSETLEKLVEKFQKEGYSCEQ